MATAMLINLRPMLLPCLVVLGAACAPSGADEASTQVEQTAEVQAAGSVRGLLFAEPFRLERSYTHDWRAEAPLVDAGWLLVLGVDPVVAARSQAAEPLLIVGGEAAERINDGDVSGHLVVIVPSPLDASSGLPELDPGTAMAWFGEPALPEQTGAADLARELESARAAGILSLGQSPATRAGAIQRVPALLSSRTALERRAAGLVSTWSPAERALAESLLAPLIE